MPSRAPMFKNHLTFLIRSIRRQKAFAFINVAGLAGGIACFLLVFLYVDFELGFDRFHENSDRIYRVVRECERQEGTSYRVDTGGPMGPMLASSLPGVENTVQFLSFYEGNVITDDNSFNEDRFFWTGESMFDVFTFPLAMGDEETALSEPSSVVLTQASARKYFGKENPIGQQIRYKARFFREAIEYTVTGVFEEIPANSHLEFDFLASIGSLQTVLPPSFFTSRWDGPVINYVLLQEGVRVETLTQPLNQLSDQNIDPGSCTAVQTRLDPMDGIYYNSSNMGGGVWRRGDRQSTLLFLGLACLVLLIACVNFMNLSTARSATRAREVGVRKVLGGQRGQIIKQFLGESVFYSMIALLVGFGLVEILLPVMSDLVGVELQTNYLGTYSLIAVGVALLAGLISGSYPALFLSRFIPTRVLKGDFVGGSAAGFRKGLVTFQFVVSVVLIAGSIKAFEQMQFMQNTDLGFRKEHLVVVPIEDQNVLRQYLALKDELLRNPRIQTVTGASQMPGVTSPNGIQMRAPDIDDMDMQIIYVDYDYVETLEIELASGRSFRQDAGNDGAGALLVNESVLEEVGWEDAVGKDVELFFTQGGEERIMYTPQIIGVVKDFNFRSLNMSIAPVLFKISHGRMQYVLIRIEGIEPAQTVAFIQDTFKRFAPEVPVTASFLDDETNNAYREFQKISRIIQYSTLLAIIVACLGLFGLALSETQARTKEIGIRKVLGADVHQVLFLLLKDIARVVLLAFVVAVPIAYMVMSRFLEEFAFRVDIGISVFVLALVISLVLTLLTVSFHAVKAAIANPVNSLKTE